jgi:Ca-activated chloride channel family protein
MKMKAGILLFLLILSFLMSAGLVAQVKNDNEEILRVETQVVDVPIVVNDKTGKPLLNLKQNNFVVYEDGARQDISDFSTTNAPFEVALLLDTSGSTRADLQLIQRAAAGFIASLRPGDRVSIVAFKTENNGTRRFSAPAILSGLTDNRTALTSALEKVGTSSGTPYYDTLLQVMAKVFSEKPKDEFRGRRALVALTDGVDSTSISDFDEVKEDIQRAGIVCYFINVDTSEYFESQIQGDCETVLAKFSAAQIRRYYRVFYPKKADVEKVYDFCQLGEFERMTISKRLYELADLEMNTLAKQSGGKVFPVGDLTEARNAFKNVSNEIGTKYSLGYYSSNEKRDGTYRKIRVELKGLAPGASVRAREGYTAPTN